MSAAATTITTNFRMNCTPQFIANGKHAETSYLVLYNPAEYITMTAITKDGTAPRKPHSVPPQILGERESERKRGVWVRAIKA